MTALDRAAIRSVQRPVHTLWSFLFVGPASAFAGELTINHTRLNPMALTVVAVTLSLISAGLFLQGHLVALIAGAVLYQLSTLADALDGLVARAKKGSGSVTALVLDHALDPWRLVLNVLALAHGQYLRGGDEQIFFWVILFFAIHFTDWVQPRTIFKLRQAYGAVYQPRLGALDHWLLSAKSRFERRSLRVIFFSVHEREVCILLLAPLTGLVMEMLIMGTLLTAVFFILRLRFDVALLKNQLINGADEYLGDTENKWEAGLPGAPK